MGLIGGGIYYFVQQNNSNANNNTNQTDNTPDSTVNQPSNARIVDLIYDGLVEGDMYTDSSESNGYLFKANSDDDNSAYFISNTNFTKWSDSGIMPKEFDSENPIVYKVDIKSAKPLTDDDGTIDSFEITELNVIIIK